jgi:hypothetical protein
MIWLGTAHAAAGQAAPASNTIVVVGEQTPWTEMLSAELAMMDLELSPGWAGTPGGPADVEARLDEWNARVLVVTGDTVALHLRRCDATVRTYELPAAPSPGRASLLAAELIHAHLRVACTEPASPPGAAERAQHDRIEPETWQRPRPQLAGPAKGGEPSTSRGMPLALQLSAGTLVDRAHRFALVGGGSLRLALRPNLSVRIGARGGRNRTVALGSAELGLRAGIGQRTRWFAGGGFALAWSRALLPPLDTHQANEDTRTRARRVAPGFYLGTGLQYRVGSWAFGIEGRLVQTRRHHRVYASGEDLGRLGPLLSAEWTLERHF